MKLKLFNAFGPNPYATLPKLETIIRKACRRHVLDVKRDDASFIISTDRAEVGLIRFKVYARSFDVQFYDANGVLLLPMCSIHGTHWKTLFERKLNYCIAEMRKEWVPAGHKIDMQWADMMRQIAYADEEMSKFPEPVIDRIGDGQAWMSPAMATAVYMNCIIGEEFL